MNNKILQKKYYTMYFKIFQNQANNFLYPYVDIYTYKADKISTTQR